VPVAHAAIAKDAVATLLMKMKISAARIADSMTMFALYSRKRKRPCRKPRSTLTATKASVETSAHASVSTRRRIRGEGASPGSVSSAGVVRTRSGDQYKPSALRSYEQSLSTHVLPKLGRMRFSAISRVTIQDLVDHMVASGAAPSTTRNAVLPMRAIYRRSLARNELMLNPTERLALPAGVDGLSLGPNPLVIGSLAREQRVGGARADLTLGVRDRNGNETRIAIETKVDDRYRPEQPAAYRDAGFLPLLYLPGLRSST